MPPEDVYVLIPHTCECVTLHGTRGFTDVITLRTGEWKIILDYQGGPSIVIRFLVRGRQKGWRERKGDMTAKSGEDSGEWKQRLG